MHDHSHQKIGWFTMPLAQPDTKPQACPACGKAAMQFENEGYFRCPDKFCCLSKEHFWWHLKDWQRLRYVSEDAPQPKAVEQHWCQCETVGKVARDGKSTCAQCGGKDAYKKSPDRPKAAPTPRRMQGTGHVPQQGYSFHFHEHDEVDNCKIHGCQPVEAEQPAAPCAKYNVSCPVADNCNGHDATCGQYVAKDKAPEPGDGWRLLNVGETVKEGDEIKGASDWWIVRDMIGSKLSPYTQGVYRRRVEPQAQGWEDIPIVQNLKGDRWIRFAGVPWMLHVMAPSLRGFMGYVYSRHDMLDGLSLHPCRWNDDKIEFPAAVRFEKGK